MTRHCLPRSLVSRGPGPGWLAPVQARPQCKRPPPLTPSAGFQFPMDNRDLCPVEGRDQVWVATCAGQAKATERFAEQSAHPRVWMPMGKGEDGETGEADARNVWLVVGGWWLVMEVEVEVEVGDEAAKGWGSWMRRATLTSSGEHRQCRSV